MEWVATFRNDDSGTNTLELNWQLAQNCQGLVQELDLATLKGKVMEYAKESQTSTCLPVLYSLEGSFERMGVIGIAENMQSSIIQLLKLNENPSANLPPVQTKPPMNLQVTEVDSASDQSLPKPKYIVERVHVNPNAPEMIYGIKVQSGETQTQLGVAYAYDANGWVRLDHTLPQPFKGSYVPIFYNVKDRDNIAILEVLDVSLTPSTIASE
ncbi:hypothetical protein H4R34_000893 [Dimargaris verticillata]|uniref:Uncharacterized protein n=1 Tax=Dimargaris verticillata TaxID=2761393 RepID=A0A9W8B9J7_9FUNG|nr:hypothetical protein H4R34_000893 [Dimargaris verticillata]